MAGGNHTEPRNLSEAIERLEKVTQNKSQEFRDMFSQDYSELKKALEDLKPYLRDIGDRVSGEVNNTKKSVENKMQENPWTSIAIVGLIGLFLGWIFGFGGRRGD